MNFFRRNVRFHQVVLILASLALIGLLLKSAAWFNQQQQRRHTDQLETVASTLLAQISGQLAPLLNNSNASHARIEKILKDITKNPLIPSASLYDISGVMIAQAGEGVKTEEANNSTRPLRDAARQLVQPLMVKDQPKGFLRVTFDIDGLYQQAAPRFLTANRLLRAMLVVAILSGFLLAWVLRLTPAVLTDAETASPSAAPAVAEEETVPEAGPPAPEMEYDEWDEYVSRYTSLYRNTADNP